MIVFETVTQKYELQTSKCQIALKLFVLVLGRNQSMEIKDIEGFITSECLINCPSSDIFQHLIKFSYFRQYLKKNSVSLIDA